MNLEPDHKLHLLLNLKTYCQNNWIVCLSFDISFITNLYGLSVFVSIIRLNYDYREVFGLIFLDELLWR